MTKHSKNYLKIKKIEKLIREQKFKLFGYKCQFCNGTTGLGLFHILAVSTHPRIRLHEDNLLISGWFCCHYRFHHDPYFARDIIFPKIRELCGDDYEERLQELEKTMPKLNMARLEEIHEEYKSMDI